MKNSKIYYLYRDASNYKVYHEVTIYGTLTLDELSPYFYDHQFFIPSKVGFEDLQAQPLTFDDHIWHELRRAELV